LLILGGNPVFNAPADLTFLEVLNKVPFRVHLAPDEDETSLYCHWHIPQAHFLESWSDARAYDGTASIIQPLIEPLYDGRSAHEILSVLLAQPETRPYDRIRQYWLQRMAQGDFEKTWRRALHDGVIAGTASPSKAVSLRAGFDQASETVVQGLEVVLRPDPTIWDGRYANNGWLQELPKPLTRLTWDNAAHFSPATAERFGLDNQDVIELQFKGRSIEAPVWISPGQADDSVLVHFGYGRQRVGRVGKGAGFNAYALRTSDSPWQGSGLEIRKMGRRDRLATVQDHGSMEGRHLVRWASIGEFRDNPHAPHEGVHEPPEGLSLYPADHKYEGNAWGMTIDLNACTGCNACMLACQSENNIPVVGKEQVLNGREMHWIRVDRYYEGPLDSPEIHHQPIPCMQCENAPCEVVCPVGATVHSSEGLNDMVYNRCVGTRYCSNNCPYKVRRFNFLLYADYETPSLKLLRNPDVTVRSRGVMEKCTYCVQRINTARIDAGKQGREIRDGEITTACQQVCPSQAIVFGNINDPESRVAKAKADPRNYGLLMELNTKPRTTYLAKLRNPNPEMGSESVHG
jgi:molybdopterin-containing oxidoreductase family iron-sulfur binding subunit